MNKDVSLEQYRLFTTLIHPGIGRHLHKHSSPNSLTLEIGCGPGQYRLAVRGNYVGFDLTTDDYQPGIPRIIDLVADARGLPFKFETFDLVFFSNIFHYFEDALDVLRGAVSVLKPSGTLLIFDYSQNSLERLALEYNRSSQGFMAFPKTAKMWLDLFRNAGLTELTVEPNASGWRRIRLAWLRMTVDVNAVHRWIDDHTGALVVSGRRK